MRNYHLSLEHSQLVVCPQTLSVVCRFTQLERTFMIIYLSLTASFNPDREALRKPAEAGITDLRDSCQVRKYRTNNRAMISGSDFRSFLSIRLNLLPSKENYFWKENMFGFFSVAWVDVGLLVAGKPIYPETKSLRILSYWKSLTTIYLYQSEFRQQHEFINIQIFQKHTMGWDCCFEGQAQL